ncbi:phenylalanine--tRNA ligase subunit beta [Streptobacillus felis]|uniref:Phenylalanine--tRNA ligase beta subunit n=1 Tax=Streptobacillus felis TaxID=1384509 RepID=A0A7Z0PF03_9FUSO|nr:phenylalanine--tRNA ligase subunit beta [Streptobacillus felis]NYV28048.1 phenylalanine--tRNA ligase subunit beta [Streptobacillus felis]
MLISLNWLREYIDLDKNIDIKELENALTMIGQEVEKIEKQGERLTKVLTAKVLEKVPHPNSDHISICQVDNGTEVLQVLCGAPNHKVGDIVAMAQIGAELEEGFVIKKAKIRGEESNGMLCSETEMKIGKDHDGIMILPQDTKLGIPMNEYLGLDDIVFELEITPNRPDCLSHLGIARELAAYYSKVLKVPTNEVVVEGKENVEISIEEGLSNRYLARVIKGVKVGESPKWLKNRLEAVGIRSINNIVDISNYVMMETNQPNHIFDFNKFNSNKVTVSRAKNEEVFVTLDEKERILDNEDIVITNGEKTVALAGVMGGTEVEVDDNTTDILIEVAHFDNIMVRKTNRKFALSTESAYRFERAVNTENMEYVLDRISSLVKELAGGTICNINDNYPVKPETKTTTLSIPRLYRFVGKEIEKDKIIDIFEKLEVKVEDKGEELLLIAPSHRQDLVNQFDYFEEVIRMVGFDSIENVMPTIKLSKDRLEDTTKFVTDIKKITSNLGLREVINYSFIPKNALEKVLFEIPSENVIEIKNPIVEEFSILRPTLMYSLIKNVRDNVNRGAADIRFFEVSKRFTKENVQKVDEKAVELGQMQVFEKETLALVLSGSKIKNIWNAKPENYDFYDMKGVVEALFEKIGFNKYQIRRSSNKAYHPGRSVDVFVGKELVATYGELHPDVLENMDAEKCNILYAEVYLDLIKKYISNNVKYKGLSKYQSVPRDIAIVVNENVLVGEMLKTIEKADKLIEKVELFDIYQGLGIEKGYKSVAISIVMRDDNKTLEEKDIVEVMNKIINKLTKDFGATLRV